MTSSETPASGIARRDLLTIAGAGAAVAGGFGMANAALAQSQTGLVKTGWVLLTGDAAHFKDNWDNDRVPSINTNAEQTHASHALLAKIVAEKKAALWINHDLPTFDSLKHSPEFYD